MGFAGIGDWVALALVGALIRMGNAFLALRGCGLNHSTPPSFPKSSSVAKDADRTDAFCCVSALKTLASRTWGQVMSEMPESSSET
jgi:hypothetical protein